VTITEAEFEEMGRRYGGLRKLGVRADYVDGELRLTLVTAPERPRLS
jgi:hypothetical protein